MCHSVIAALPDVASYVPQKDLTDWDDLMTAIPSVSEPTLSRPVNKDITGVIVVN